MKIIKWTDIFGQEHALTEGKNDDIFHVIPSKKDDEGNSFIEILSKKAIIEMANELQSN